MLTEEVGQHLLELGAFDRFHQPDSTWSFLLCGIEAHVCLLQTALELRERHADVHVLADGVSSRFEFERFMALRRLEKEGIKLTTAESAAFQLLADAKNPKFKEVQALFIGDRPATGLDRLMDASL